MKVVSQCDGDENVVARYGKDRIEGDKSADSLDGVVGKVERVEALNGTSPCEGIQGTIGVGFLVESEDGTVIEDIVEHKDECHGTEDERCQVSLLPNGSEKRRQRVMAHERVNGHTKQFGKARNGEHRYL